MITYTKEQNEILAAINNNNTPRHNEAYEIIGVITGIAVLKEISSKPTFPNELFTAAIQDKNGNWRRTGVFSATAENCLLNSLGIKFEGPNSQFGYYAARMLNAEKQAY